MELVYLWVEKYKNIEKQGFDFSPNYDVEFTPIYEDEELSEKSELKITPKFNPLKDFFGKDINVTAIVGENGSGKSNILEILFGNNIIDDCKFFYVVEVQVGNNKTRNIIAYKFDNTMSIYSKELKLDKTYKLSDFNNEEKSIDKFSTLFYSTSSYTDNMSNQNSNIKNAENLAISEKETYLSYKLKSIQYAIFMIKNNANFEKLFELPKSITIGVKKYEKPKFWKELKPSDTFIDKVKMAIICEIYKKRQEEVDEKIKDYSSNLNTIFSKIIEMPVFGGLKEDTKEFIEEAGKINEKYNVGVQININNIETNFMNTYHNMVNSFFKLDIDLNILDFSWYPHLSTGQETYLFQFANFYNAMKKDDDIHNNCIILVDEGECTLHPNWQKKYINYLSNFLKDNFQKKNIHLILSSHSPFILSDIPKENVIFLEKYKENDEEVKKDIQKLGNCKNASKDIELNTFGANIHTLLSNGFFMSDGLMGEFAKSKINKAITLLNQKTLTKKEIDYCENIISIIGEPILKRQLQKMLDSKRLVGIDSINQKIKDMEYELEILKKHQKGFIQDEIKDKAKRKYHKKKKDDSSK